MGDIRSSPYAAYLDGGFYWKNVYSKGQLLRAILEVSQEQNDTELTCFSTRITIQNTASFKIFLWSCDQTASVIQGFVQEKYTSRARFISTLVKTLVFNGSFHYSVAFLYSEIKLKLIDVITDITV